MTATRGSWKALPLGPTTPFAYSASFSPEEARLIRGGAIPREMEDKWFIFWEDDSLFFHRSWTGLGIYQVDFHCAEDRLDVVRALVTADRKQYPRGSDHDEAALLDFLIRALLLGQEVTFPVPASVRGDATPGAYQAHIAGTGYPERRLPPKDESWLSWFLGLFR